MTALPPPSGPPVVPHRKNPVYRLADWFQKYPHYAAGFIALVVLLFLQLATGGALFRMFGY